MQAARKVKAKVCAVEAKIQLIEGVLDDCAIPYLGATSSWHFELPQSSTTSFSPILEKYKDLFCTSLGYTNLVEHFIPMSGTPVKVPPRRIHAIPGPVTYVINDGTRYRTVHVNHLQYRIQPDFASTPIHAESGQNHTTWRAPTRGASH